MPESEIPRTWWSSKLGLIIEQKHGGCFDVIGGKGLDEVQSELSTLPDDVTELVPIHHKTVALHQQLVEDEITTREEDDNNDFAHDIAQSILSRIHDQICDCQSNGYGIVIRGREIQKIKEIILPELISLTKELMDDRIEEDNIHDLLSAIWLSVNWRSVTKNLTLSQKTLWADYLDSHTFKIEEKVDRWWI